MSRRRGRVDLSSVTDRLRSSGCVFAEDEARLLRAATVDEPQLLDMVERRAAGQPLETVLGSVAFCGIDILVRPGVFVPRQRSRLLVERAVAACRRWERRDGGPPVVVDVCTGSGALAAAVADRVSQATIVASDTDPLAVACARRNGERYGFSVLRADLMDGLPEKLCGRVAVIVANVPYVPTDQLPFLPRDVRAHEPLAALDGGTAGLDVFDRLVRMASSWLAVGGVVMSEVSPQQVPLAVASLEGCGLTADATDYPSWRTSVVEGLKIGPGCSHAPAPLTPQQQQTDGNGGRTEGRVPGVVGEP